MSNEIYAGAIINPDGTGHRIFLLDGEHDGTDWQSAMDWAKEQGGDLPSRAELILLYENHPEKFEERAYWSNTQRASLSDYAWYQNFCLGTQHYWLKDYELRARAVRRLDI